MEEEFKKMSFLRWDLVGLGRIWPLTTDGHGLTRILKTERQRRLRELHELHELTRIVSNAGRNKPLPAFR